MGIKNVFGGRATGNISGSALSPFHIQQKDVANLFALPQTQWNWHMVIPNLPAEIDTGLSSLIPGNVGSTLDNIKRSAQLAFNVKSLNLPPKQVDTAEVTFFGRKRKVPMATHYQDNQFEVVFEEYENQVVFSTFTRWVDYISNSVIQSGGLSGAIGNILGTKNASLGANYSDFDSYSSDILIFMEMAIGMPNNFIKIKDCYPINITQQSSLDYSGNGPIIYQVTFAFSEYSFISRQDVL